MLIIKIDENSKFYQNLRSKRKRTYKEIEDDSEKIKMEADHLLKAKKDLELWLDDLHQELELYKNRENEQIDYKQKLEDLQKLDIIDEGFNPK